MTARTDKRLVKKCLDRAAQAGAPSPGRADRRRLQRPQALKKLQSCKLAEALPVQHLTP